ncbi:MAG: PhoH family protein [Hellea sp.]|jgi:phosphate starvation-inducible PhoH-like protein|nr:PhoH family protein [Hellea sp.]MBT4994908.1 PhoH family protein [Hellea sp.]MBT5836163.1 PhoH family protein [Hellea sp.]
MSKETQVLEFPDADLVRKMCGPNHANLALIEEAFGVYIEAPGASVHINGDGPSIARSGELIKEVYQRLERGWPCGISDIRALIKAIGKGKVKAAAADAIIPFPRRSPIVPKTPKQEKFIHAMRDETICFGVGPAGTGKTFLATAYGASLLARGEIARFIACRPAVEAGERLGFLPGDLNEKVDPYMQPIWDALHMVLGRDEVDRRRASGDIEVAPLAFMRGRTLSDAFVVIDEAQNATIPQMKMVLTRLGERAKYAVTGDPSQSDLPSGVTSGLAHALDILKDIRGIEQIVFEASDVVRHPLVGRIVNAYEKASKSRGGISK